MTELTNEQINKRIHELLGLCWHKNLSLMRWECLDCHRLPLKFNFTTSWEGFGILWGWLQKHERREEFYVSNGWHIPKTEPHSGWCLPITIISPSALSRAVVKFFRETVPLPNLQGWGEEDGFTKEAK